MYGDRDKITLAMFVAIVLHVSKHSDMLPDYIKWQLKAYTNWNLTLIMIRILFGVKEWDPFLCVNSMGIFFAFKTAFTQGLDENIRLKLSDMGLKMTKLEFKIGDIFVHFVPMISTFGIMLHQKRKIPLVTLTYAMTLSTWFAFSQVGKLDPSDIYVPHPWKRAWVSAVSAMCATPLLLDGIQNKTKLKIIISSLMLILPYLSTKLDNTLLTKYKFEFALTKQTNLKTYTIQRNRSEPIIKTKVI